MLLALLGGRAECRDCQEEGGSPCHWLSICEDVWVSPTSPGLCDFPLTHPLQDSGSQSKQSSTTVQKILRMNISCPWLVGV